MFEDLENLFCFFLALFQRCTFGGQIVRHGSLSICRWACSLISGALLSKLLSSKSRNNGFSPNGCNVLQGKEKRIPVPVPPLFLRRPCNGEKMAVTNEFAFFSLQKHAYRGVQRVQNQAEKIRKNVFQPVPVPKSTFPILHMFKNSWSSSTDHSQLGGERCLRSGLGEPTSIFLGGGSWSYRCRERGLDGQNRQSPIASVQRTRSTHASHSAILRGMLYDREWTPITRIELQHNERKVHDDLLLCF